MGLYNPLKMYVIKLIKYICDKFILIYKLPSNPGSPGTPSIRGKDIEFLNKPRIINNNLPLPSKPGFPNEFKYFNFFFFTLN